MNMQFSPIKGAFDKVPDIDVEDVEEDKEN